MYRLLDEVYSEVARVDRKYGVMSSDLLFYEELINLSALLAKEAGETVSCSFKMKNDLYLKDIDYDVWAITHNAIQTCSAAIRLIRLLELTGYLNMEKFDMQKPPRGKKWSTRKK